MKHDVSDLRNEYLKSTLSDFELNDNPTIQFTTWFEEALSSEQLEPNAMILSTVDAESQPSQRTVLLKGFDENGFVFYTNYESRKGHQLQKNPRVNLLFPWYFLQRQVIICGSVSKVSTKDSEKYFHSRPRGSQLSAYISNQSEEISSREELESKLASAESNFAGQDIPLPKNWGGYLVKPVSFEFWQGRKNRLHDRFLYELHDNDWKISRLAP